MTIRSTVTARPGLLSRLTLTESLRHYLYGLGCGLVAGLVLAGAPSGGWGDYLSWALGVVLCLGGGIEAARSSVFAPTTVVRRLVANRDRMTGSADLNGAAGPAADLEPPEELAWWEVLAIAVAALLVLGGILVFAVGPVPW